MTQHNHILTASQVPQREPIIALDRDAVTSGVFRLPSVGRAPQASIPWCVGNPKQEGTGGELCVGLKWQCSGAAPGVAGAVDISCDAKSHGVLCSIDRGCGE